MGGVVGRGGCVVVVAAFAAAGCSLGVCGGVGGQPNGLTSRRPNSPPHAERGLILPRPIPLPSTTRHPPPSTSTTTTQPPAQPLNHPHKRRHCNFVEHVRASLTHGRRPKNARSEARLPAHSTCPRPPACHTMLSVRWAVKPAPLMGRPSADAS